ncbi:hypothetical protein [Streptomyces sp. NPDC058657]|uniref:hypothetical protein n=1 Tax=unclassified Streptomyces TaxID=2593676 RepID=UPI00364690AA
MVKRVPTESRFSELEERLRDAGKAREHRGLLLAQLLTELSAEALQSAVDSERARGTKWDEIGAVLGVTRQAAHSRFVNEGNRRPTRVAFALASARNRQTRAWEKIRRVVEYAPYPWKRLAMEDFSADDPSTASTSAQGDVSERRDGTVVSGSPVPSAAGEDPDRSWGAEMARRIALSAASGQLVITAAPGEGKSHLALNMARSLADAEAVVVMVPTQAPQIFGGHHGVYPHECSYPTDSTDVQQPDLPGSHPPRSVAEAEAWKLIRNESAPPHPEEHATVDAQLGEILRRLEALEATVGKVRRT